jgi:dienelactone hydrolase
MSACLPPSEFEKPWPDGVPVQVHMMDKDPWGEEDLPVARELVADAPRSELFLYPGEGHLFADSSLPEFHAESATLLKERVLKFLADAG